MTVTAHVVRDGDYHSWATLERVSGTLKRRDVTTRRPEDDLDTGSEVWTPYLGFVHDKHLHERAIVRTQGH